MRIAAFIVLIFLARMTLSAWFYPGHDADLGWQSWLGDRVLATHHIPASLGGETFTAPGAPWVAQEWAFGTAVAWTYAHHNFWILALLTAFAAAGAILLTAYRAKRRGSTNICVALATACTAFSMLQAFGVRAQIFGWLLLSLLMLVLDLEGYWVYFALPIVAIWANLHASAVLAPVLVAAWAFGTWIEDRAWTPRVARNFFMAAGCWVALCLTPLLAELPRYAFSLQTSPIRGTIAEWQPSEITDIAMYLGALPLIAISVYFGIAAPRERWRDGMLFAIAAPMSFMAVRHLPICALVIAPMAAQRLSSVVGPYARVNVILREWTTTAFIGFASVVCAFAIVSNLRHVPSVTGVTLPKAAIAKISSIHGMHNLYCEDFAWCSLALSEPNLRVFVDGRCDPFPNAVWDEYIAVEHLHPDWSAVLTKYGVDAILAKRGNPLAQALALRPQWHAVYDAHGFTLFYRSSVRTARS